MQDRIFRNINQNVSHVNSIVQSQTGKLDLKLFKQILQPNNFHKNKRIFLKCGHLCHEKSRPSNVCYSRGFYRSDQGALQRLWCFVPSPLSFQNTELILHHWRLKSPHSPLKGFLQKLVNTVWVGGSCLQVLSLVHRHFLVAPSLVGIFYKNQQQRKFWQQHDTQEFFSKSTKAQCVNCHCAMNHQHERKRSRARKNVKIFYILYDKKSDMWKNFPAF